MRQEALKWFNDLTPFKRMLAVSKWKKDNPKDARSKWSYQMISLSDGTIETIFESLQENKVVQDNK
jgi:hypothetical protein